MDDKMMKNTKCPRCSYPFSKKLKIYMCNNCNMVVHEMDLFMPDYYGKAVYLGKLSILLH